MAPIEVSHDYKIEDEAENAEKQGLVLMSGEPGETSQNFNNINSSDVPFHSPKLCKSPVHLNLLGLFLDRS